MASRPSWLPTRNQYKRLTGTPKHHLADPALAARLLLGLDAKLSPDVQDEDVRHLLWLRDQDPSSVKDLVVVTTGSHAYRRSDGVAVVPLALLGP